MQTPEVEMNTNEVGLGWEPPRRRWRELGVASKRPALEGD